MVQKKQMWSYSGKSRVLIRQRAEEDLNPKLDWPISADSLVYYDLD